MIQPALTTERMLWDSGYLRVVGVDEAGLGALCGAVIAAAVLLPPYCDPLPGVRDSKTLSRSQRERLFAAVIGQSIRYGVGAASPAEIDRLNVRVASHLAMRRALTRIGPYDLALIDGAQIKDPTLGARRTIIDGDASSYAIACASILAKVMRDRLMIKLAHCHPDYGWEHNVGYGTAEHHRALQRLGITPYHRRTYAPIRALLSGTFPLPGLLGG